ncbi:helix-turn-helix domain-containing protein [Paenibacillus sp. VCA1]|uniref:winged helix-turn-helix transcriptional regulator n=1 Tax=Paenibacillus sp. VCA1 TaxID=3039148 RepID=UPI00287244F2|nr:helix-turn-helix domain-containing protein [Paenibacillus sp. VCA1]MDR9855381.1 helix-turn-helix domain-containing protein [Paenibacillus sp. VCA1]
MSIKTEEELCLYNIQQAIEVLGGKWSFLVLGQLFCHDVQRFNQMRRTLKHISTKSLTDTLRHLEQNEIIKRTVLPTVPVTVEYSLTEKGRDFKTIISEMRSWGEKWGEGKE